MEQNRRLVKQPGRRFYQDTVTGKLFTSKKAFREYLKRSAFQDWGTRKPTTDSYVVRRNTGAVLASPDGSKHIVGCNLVGHERRDLLADQPTADRKRKPRASNANGYRVHPVNGVWRRKLVTPDGERWLSDHSTMQDALAGVNPLKDDSVVKRQHVIVQSVKEWRGD